MGQRVTKCYECGYVDNPTFFQEGPDGNKYCSICLKDFKTYLGINTIEDLDRID